MKKSVIFIFAVILGTGAGSDITDFIAANRDSRDITDNVADKLEMLTELFS